MRLTVNVESPVPVGEHVHAVVRLGVWVEVGLRVRLGDRVNDVVPDKEGVTTWVGVTVLCVADVVSDCEGVVPLVDVAVLLSVLVGVHAVVAEDVPVPVG